MATQIDDKYKSPYGDHEWQECYGIWEGGFERGVQWMIEKATTWLNKNAGNFYIGDAQSDNCYYDVDELISYFQKAMEE